jgi:penicillin amidase
MHYGASAASERMVVSPGHEEEGIMQMPTGQSGHPLSPFYGNSHPAWVAGEPTPFLPGATEHTLTLVP